MSSPEENESHHYPPTTAVWATSPLAEQDGLADNPLEAPPLTSGPGTRFGAILIIGGGLLALSALVAELYVADITSLLTWSLLWRFGVTTIVGALITIVFPMAFAIGGIIRGTTLFSQVTRRYLGQIMQFAAGGLFLQLLALFLAWVQIVSTRSQSGQASGQLLGPANWLSLGAFLVMLTVSWLIGIVVKPPLTPEDVRDNARFRSLMGRRRNGDVRLQKIPFRDPGGTRLFP